MTEREQRWALITGASAGIGEECANVFAQNGFNVVLVARREDRLRKHANWLESKYGVETHVIQADLEKADACHAVFDETERMGLEISALVNNAGYGVPGHFSASEWAHHEASIELMVTAVCRLTYLYLAKMKEHHYGRIINVASLAALVPGSAGHTLYGAQKAFLVKFSQSLWAENYGSGVHVSALCPGFTYSEFHDVIGVREQMSELPKFMWMDAKTVAEQGFQAVMDNKPVYVNGRWNKFVAWMARHLPPSLIEAIIRRQSAKVRRQEV